MTFECSSCGREFDSKRGASVHESTAHSDPWHEEEKLRELYVAEEMSSEEMAREWGCDPKTVRNNLERFGIERRTPGFYQRKQTATYRIEEVGYCNWWDSQRRVAVHRLLAVAEYGLSAVSGMHVHHQNGVKWDNRHENIELAEPGEHASMHVAGVPRASGGELKRRGETDELAGGLDQ